MTVRAKFAPNKNTGQGFGSATNQFLDVYIKYDLATNTGYGLRIQRLTTEEINAIGYKGAGAVAGCAFFLVKFENGVMTPVSKKVMSSAFRRRMHGGADGQKRPIAGVGDLHRGNSQRRCVRLSKRGPV